MLIDAAGAGARECRDEIDVLLSVAAADGGIAAFADARPGYEAQQLRIHDLAGSLGASVPQIRWAVDVWFEALGLPVAAPPPPPPRHVDRPVGSNRTGRVIAVASAMVVVVVLVMVGAALYLRDDEPSAARGTTSTTSSSTSTSTSTSTSSTTTSSTTTSQPEALVWADTTEPSALHSTILEQVPVMFEQAASCRPISDEDFDALGTYPQGPDEASIECTYPSRGTIVFSLFADDVAMRQFFEGRLPGRDLVHGQGRIGPSPKWQLDYSGDSLRGSGSIFGYQRLGLGARSEVGWIQSGTRIYAYSYALGTDFAAYYRWWASVFAGPAPPG